MSIKDSYINKRVTSDTKDSLEEKIDRLMIMISKLTAQHDEHNKQFKPKTYEGKRRGQMRHFMINVVMVREIIRIDIDQTVGIEEFHLVVGYYVDEIT